MKPHVRSLAFFAVLGIASASAEFRLADDAAAITVYDADKPVLTFRYADVTPPNGVPEQYHRSGYVHPLYGLDGEILTEDFPVDHYHHRGVFCAWPETKVGDKKIDIWTLVGARTKFETWRIREVGPDAVVLSAASLWTFDEQPEVPLVRDIVTMTIHEASERGRAIDFTLRFENIGTQPVTFQGSLVNNKGYGGFGMRPDAKRKPFEFTAATGPIQKDVFTVPSPWVDISFDAGTIGKAGVAIFQHPANPGFPHDGWITRAYGFLGASWPHIEPYVLSPSDALDLRYRLYVHRGDAPAGGVAPGFDSYVNGVRDKSE